MKTLTPAYGRDYKSRKAAVKDFLEGKDFILNDITDRYDGKPCNLEDLKKVKVHQVKLRFNNLTSVTVVDL